MGADEFLSDEPLILLSDNNFSFSAYEYYQNPESQYFNVGKIDDEQLDSYAKRKGMVKDVAERWLSAHLHH